MSNKRAIAQLATDSTTETRLWPCRAGADSAVTRDRHNVFGVTVGGHADVYVKTSEYPHAHVMQNWNLVGTGTYELDDVESDGMYAVSDFRHRRAQIGSYEFEETRKIAVETPRHCTT